MVAGVVPQSSCSLRPMAPAAIWSSRPSGREELPLPVRPTLSGRTSVACSIRAMLNAPGVQVVAVGAAGWPGAAADHGGDASRERLVGELGADEVHVRVDGAGGDDQALAGDGLRRDADDHARRDAGHRVRVAGLADAGDAPALYADVGLDDARPVDDQRVGDDAVERLGVAASRALALGVAQHLAAAELALVAVDGVVVLDLDHQVRVAEADAVAGRRAEHVDVLGARQLAAHAAPSTAADEASATSCTSRASPGSNLTAVPAGMSSRMPRAASRSNSSAVFVSANA